MASGANDRLIWRVYIWAHIVCCTAQRNVCFLSKCFTKTVVLWFCIENFRGIQQHIVDRVIVRGGWVASFRGTSAWLSWLVTGLSLGRPGFEATSVHVEFGVDEVAMGEVFPCKYHSTIALYSFICYWCHIMLATDSILNNTQYIKFITQYVQPQSAVSHLVKKFEQTAFLA